MMTKILNVGMVFVFRALEGARCAVQAVCFVLLGCCLHTTRAACGERKRKGGGKLLGAITREPVVSW